MGRSQFHVKCAWSVPQARGVKQRALCRDFTSVRLVKQFNLFPFHYKVHYCYSHSRSGVSPFSSPLCDFGLINAPQQQQKPGLQNPTL